MSVDTSDFFAGGARAERERLAQACAPIFLHLVTFRRNAATCTQSLATVQGALMAEIDRVREHCDRDRRLRQLFERVWYGIVATADQVVLSSAWTQKATWSMKLLETHYFQTAEAGHRFYVLVDEVLADPGPDAPELAEVLFTCMAIGFQGELLGERRELERRRRELFDKARLAGQVGGVLTPDAYGRNVVREIPRLPTVGILRLVAVALGAVIFALVAGKFSVGQKNQDTFERIDAVLEKLDADAR